MIINKNLKLEKSDNIVHIIIFLSPALSKKAYYHFFSPQHINPPTHEYTDTSTHQHINTSAHQHVSTSTHQHINTINTSTHQHINTSTHQHIDTPTHRNTSSQQWTYLITSRVLIGVEVVWYGVSTVLIVLLLLAVSLYELVYGFFNLQKNSSNLKISRL